MVQGSGSLYLLHPSLYSFSSSPSVFYSNDDKSFEAHPFLSKIREAKLVRGSERNVIRLLGEGSKGLMSLIIQEPAEFEALSSRHGESVVFATE